MLDEREGLTRREAEILSHAADGLADKEIAVRLSIAHSTVSNHLNTIYLKLHAANRAFSGQHALYSREELLFRH